MGNEKQLGRGLRLLTLVVSGAVLLSAVAGMLLAVLLPVLVEGQRTALALFGFEIVVIVSAVLGVLAARGRFAEAPGMTLLCIGGTVFAASVLGWQGAGRQLGDVSLTPFMLLRVLAGLALVGIAAVSVLGREPRAWRPALIGAALGLPVLAACAAVVHPRGRGLLSGITGDDVMMQAGVAVVGLIVFGGLLAASVHLVIGAFDRAVGD